VRTDDHGLESGRWKTAVNNAFSFAVHAAAPAGGTQSIRIENRNTQTSSCGTQGQASCHVSNHGCRTNVNQRQVKCKETIRERERERESRHCLQKPMSPSPPSPIQDATPSGQGSYQKLSMPSTGSDLFSMYQNEVTEYKTALERAINR